MPQSACRKAPFAASFPHESSTAPLAATSLSHFGHEPDALARTFPRRMEKRLRFLLLEIVQDGDRREFLDTSPGDGSGGRSGALAPAAVTSEWRPTPAERIVFAAHDFGPGGLARLTAQMSPADLALA